MKNTGWNKKTTAGLTVCCIGIISRSIFSVIHCSYYSSQVSCIKVMFSSPERGMEFAT